MKQNTLKVLIADDHKIFRAGLITILNSINQISSIKEAQNGLEVLDLIMKESLDLIFMDVKMPGMNGIEATKTVKKLYPHIKIIALTFYDDQEFVIEMFANGASAYLLKNTDREEIEEALTTVLNDHHYYSREVSEALFKRLVDKSLLSQKSDGTLSVD
ncbi:MAG: response regulator transcription factor [Chitinophagales bacterium]|nr:response regulator transcription factor [Chitinophagales bacterium]